MQQREHNGVELRRGANDGQVMCENQKDGYAAKAVECWETGTHERDGPGSTDIETRGVICISSTRGF
jgi:hypothetical protein